jgi:hypothetical protein
MINTDEIQNSFQLPPEMQDAYQRLLAAGMKVLFSKETHELILAELEGEGDITIKLGEGVARIVVYLFSESNGTLPEEVIVPAGMILLLKAAEFINESDKGEISDEAVGQAMEIMIRSLFEGFGEDMSQLEEMAV